MTSRRRASTSARRRPSGPSHVGQADLGGVLGPAAGRERDLRADGRRRRRDRVERHQLASSAARRAPSAGASAGSTLPRIRAAARGVHPAARGQLRRALRVVPQACHRVGAAGQAPGQPHAPTPPAARRATRRRDARGGWSGPCPRRGRAPRGAGRRPSTPAAPSAATTSRPWRRSATGMPSKRASWAGVSHSASAARSTGVTRAATCRPSWRALEAHQDACDAIHQRDR